MGVREVTIVGYLGATASQETLDEVGGFDVEAEAGKPLSEYVVIDEIENLEMLNMRAVDLRPLPQALWMS